VPVSVESTGVGDATPGLGVGLGVPVGVVLGVAVAVSVEVGMGVREGVLLGVVVAVPVAVDVGVRLGVVVGVEVELAVKVGVALGSADASTNPPVALGTEVKPGDGVGDRYAAKVRAEADGAGSRPSALGRRTNSNATSITTTAAAAETTVQVGRGILSALFAAG
jgi:hypothetical protein